MTIETEVAALTAATTNLLAAVNIKKTVLDAATTTATAQAEAASTSAAAALESQTAGAASAVVSLDAQAVAESSAAAALASDNAALGSAETATTQAGIATTKASEAAESASAANTSATATVASQTAAAASAATATTQANLATTNGAAQVALATAQAVTATANAGTATTQNTAAGVSAAAAASSAAAASASKDLSIAAWAASMSPAEVLPTISKTLHTGVIVKSIIYDTGKDSDGGAWRKRCQDKSWYTETICTGQWRSQLTNLAAAWAVGGAAVGDFYQNTTDGKYYTIGGTSGAPTQTEVFRGNVREFPEQVAVVAEVARVVIYDLTQIGTPMWMVFIPTSSPGGAPYDFFRGSRNVSSIAAMQGVLLFGSNTSNNSGLMFASFVEDDCKRVDSNAIYGGRGKSIANRNSNIDLPIRLNQYIYSNAVNSVAITVLDGAPIDPVTGLPVPTVAVGATGAATILKHDGSTVNITYSDASGGSFNAGFDRVNRLFISADTGQLRYGFTHVYKDIPASNLVEGLCYIKGSTASEFYSNWQNSAYLNALALPSFGNVVPSVSTPLITNGCFVSGTSASGILQVKRHPASHMNGMTNAITNTYNSGWQVGDSRLAALADTVVETITSANPQADRSVKNNPLSVVGTLTKTAVAAGAGLVAYSGFSAANYLQQAYSANLDFGTGEFDIGAWVNIPAAATTTILERRGPSGPYVTLGTDATGKLTATAYDGTSTRTVTAPAALPFGTPTIASVTYRAGGVLSLTVNGIEVARTNGALLTMNNALAVLTVGNNYALTAPFTGSMALLTVGATAPSAHQAAHIYRTELALFQANAKCTIDGTSTAVTALAYDDTTDLLHVGTSWGRSAFKDLLRVESEATTTGAITSLSASQGSILTSGTSAKHYQPAMRLRDELRRKEEARLALGKVPVFFEFDTASFTSPTTNGSNALTASSIVGAPYIGMGITGTGIPAGTTLINIVGTTYTMSANATVTNAGAVTLSQNSFTLQQGYTAKAVYAAELLKREGATKTYVRATDGFRETINFAVSPGSAAWVSVMAIRNN